MHRSAFAFVGARKLAEQLCHGSTRADAATDGRTVLAISRYDGVFAGDCRFDAGGYGCLSDIYVTETADLLLSVSHERPLFKTTNAQHELIPAQVLFLAVSWLIFATSTFFLFSNHSSLANFHKVSVILCVKIHSFIQ